MLDTSNYMAFDVRTSTQLTSSYVAGNVIGPDLTQTSYNPNGFTCAPFNQLVLFVSFTKDTSDSLAVKIEYSHDGTNYFQDSFLSIVGGVGTLALGEFDMTTGGNYTIQRPFKATYVRVSVKANGTVGVASASIKAILAVS